MSGKKRKKKGSGRRRRRSTRAFFLGMALFAVLIVIGSEISNKVKDHRARNTDPPYRESADKKDVPTTPKFTGPPLIAIIVDDLGYELELGNKMVELEWPLTCSILPNTPHTSHFMELCRKHGKEIMLHLPMEPGKLSAEKWTPGTLSLTMDQKEMEKAIEMNLSQVPNAIGANNHMGSKFTLNETAMTHVLAKLKKMGLFYVDSLTAYKSVGPKIARRVKIRHAIRDVFIDDMKDTATPEDRVRELERIAINKGKAIGICHPRKETLEAFISELPGIVARGARIVPVSEALINP